MELKENLIKAQNQMKNYANTKRRAVQFEIGESAYLNLQPYCLRSLAQRYNEKLSPMFCSPFWVMEKFGATTYRLELPISVCIHNVFHVSQLKKLTFLVSNAQPPPKSLNKDLILIVELE